MAGVPLGLPAYQRVAAAIREQIRSGALRPGEKLPGNRELAEQHGVSLGTAQKALRLLQDDRWLIATPAVGVFVNDRQDDEPDDTPGIHRQLDALQAAVADLVTRVRRLEKGSGRP